MRTVELDYTHGMTPPDGGSFGRSYIYRTPAGQDRIVFDIDDDATDSFPNQAKEVLAEAVQTANGQIQDIGGTRPIEAFVDLDEFVYEVAERIEYEGPISAIELAQWLLEEFYQIYEGDETTFEEVEFEYVPYSTLPPETRRTVSEKAKKIAAENRASANDRRLAYS